MPVVKITTPLSKASQDEDGFYVCGNYIAVVDPAKAKVPHELTVIAIIDHHHSIQPIAEFTFRRLSTQDWRVKLAEIEKQYNIEKGN